jgi:hypothetical protein
MSFGLDHRVVATSAVGRTRGGSSLDADLGSTVAQQDRVGCVRVPGDLC